MAHDSQMATEAGCTEVEAEELEMLGRKCVGVVCFKPWWNHHRTTVELHGMSMMIRCHKLKYNHYNWMILDIY